MIKIHLRQGFGGQGTSRRRWGRIPGSATPATVRNTMWWC